MGRTAGAVSGTERRRIAVAAVGAPGGPARRALLHQSHPPEIPPRHAERFTLYV